MKKFWIRLVVLVLVVNALGFLSGYFGGSNGEGDWYRSLVKPPGVPPPIVFPIVWGSLYTLMAISFALALHGRRKRHMVGGRMKAVFALQLFVNLLYSPLFFALQSPWSGLIVSGLLLVLIIWMARAFHPASRTAAWLLAPYIAWVTFATYLGAGIVVLN